LGRSNNCEYFFERNNCELRTKEIEQTKRHGERACLADVVELDDVAVYDCSKMLNEVDALHVKRNALSGLLLFRYYRL
jgi:hypothetical protein